MNRWKKILDPLVHDDIVLRERGQVARPLYEVETRSFEPQWPVTIPAKTWRGLGTKPAILSDLKALTTGRSIVCRLPVPSRLGRPRKPRHITDGEDN